MKELLSLRSYAKHRGVALKAVQDAIESGRISVELVGNQKKIDPIKADAEWLANTDQNFIRNKQGATAKNPQIPAFQDSRALREAYAARITKLEYEEKKGELIDRAKVKMASVATAKIIREALRAIPSRIAPDLAAETSKEQIEKKLLDEIDDALTELSRYESKF